MAGGLGMAAAVVPATAWAAPGGTGHTVTTTEVTHGPIFEDFGPNPCTGASLVSFDAEGTTVDHVTSFPAGDEVWATFTETGKVAILDSNNVTLTGHFTVWGNFNLNRQNTNQTFTFSIKLTGDDGSTITGHEVSHFALNANGVVTVTFDKMSLTCG